MWGVETLRFEQGIDSTLFFMPEIYQGNSITNNKSKRKETKNEKDFFTIICVTFCLMKVQAQNDTTLTITQIWNIPGHQVRVCADRYNRVFVYPPTGCTDFTWEINGEFVYDNYVIFDKYLSYYHVAYFHGCGYNGAFEITFIESNVPNETTEELWKRQQEAITLEAPSGSYSYLWNTGATTSTIEVTEPGTYTCGVSDMCATSVQTFIVKDNVEIDLATCDLESNLNLVTWPTTVAQAQYIDHVIVKRDGLQVGTADYSDGQFTDNIGSGSASRTYTLTAIATDGTECPIVSYPKETIHMAYLTGINNTIEVNWNIPTGYDLLGYNICEWHEGDGSLTVIDFVGASVTSYTCSQSQFDEGYIVVQGMEANKDGETRLLSNRSLDLVGLDENEATAFMIYPNPAKGRFTVEGTGKMTVTNTLGQTVLIQEIDGKTTMELPQGMYFVKLGKATRKVVVE